MFGATTETKLWILISAGDEIARQAMITGHYSEIEAMARKLTNGGGEIQFQELLGEGVVSLCESVSTYLEKKPKARFGTHAYLEAKRTMIRFLRTDGTVPKPEWKDRAHRTYLKQQDKLSHQLGRIPTPEEHIEHYGKQPKLGSQESRMFGVSSVQIDEAREEAGYSVDFEGLPESTRYLLEALSNGITLGALEVETGLNRNEIEAQARTALQV